MKPSLAKKALEASVKSKQPVFMWGPPGVGKSDVVRQTAGDMGVEMVDIRAVLLDPVDLRGLPHVNGDKRAHWCPPAFLPHEPKSQGILFLDELNAAPPLTQAACFTGDTIVCGEKSKKISNLKKGDRVIDHEGNIRRVTDVFEREYCGDLFTIKGRNFLSVDATEEHPFLVIEKYQKGNEKHNKNRVISDPVWKKAKELKKGQYIGMPILNPNRDDSEVVISRKGEISTSVKITPDFARFIGYYVADGYSSNGRIGISLNRSEVEYQNDVTGIIKKVFGREPCVKDYSATGNCHDIGFGYKDLENFLKRECGKDTYHKKIPNFILYHNDIEILRNFLIGYHNGDGHLYNRDDKKCFMGFTTVSKVLALQLQQAFTRFDLLVSVCRRDAQDVTIKGKVSHQRENFRIQSSQNKIFDILCVENKNKKKRTTEHFFKDGNALWARIQDIKSEHFKGQVYNCEVEETHTYLANNYMVHNCYQLVLDRGLGEYRLPDGWAVVAAGNRETDRAVAHRMPSALANRFVHLDFTVDLEDWCTWAAKNHVRPEIVSFIQYRSNLLHQFDPKIDDKSFPTPRSWHMVSKMLDADVEKEVEFDVIRGAVGEGAAAELIGYLRVYRKLPDPQSILADPKKAKVPDDIATKYAVCGALAAFVTKKNFPNAYIYFDRLPAEFNVLAMRETYHRCPEIAGCKEFVDWAADKIDILV